MADNSRTQAETNGGTSSPDDAISKLWDLDVWVFDLDNTLYPASLDLFPQIDERMRAFIAAYLGLDLDQAKRLQKQYFHEFGMSLRGMMDCHGMDPAAFLEHVHEIDLSGLAASPALDQALSQLPGRKLIFTNASAYHAERVTDRLGVRHHFDGIFDIVEADFRPKPEIDSYRRMVERFGLDPSRTVMVEDMARNLQPAAALGMKTVWVRTGSDVGALGADDECIDHTVDDLLTWLGDVAAAGRAGDGGMRNG